MPVSGYIKAFIIFLFLALPASAPGAELFTDVTETRLENGLKLILLENHTAPVITFQVWYHAGARREAWGKTGLAHVFEHMMFKGTKNYSGEEFTRIIQSNGGNYNAFTAHDFAGYYENLGADRVEIAIELEADRMRNVVMQPDEFKTEVNVVMEERRTRVDDDPRGYLHEQVRAVAFQAQPYHWPIIGWINDLERLTVEDARAYYDTYYSPANAFVVAVGDFRTDEIIRKIDRHFGKIASGKSPPVLHYRDPPQTGERRVDVNAFAELPSVLIGYHVPNLHDPDAYVLEVIAAVLSAGKSSRLYRNLVLERLALSASAQNPLLSVDPDLFYLSAEPLPGKTPEQVEAALDRETARLRNEAVDGEELQRAKNQLETGFIYGQDSMFYQGMLLAYHEIADKWQRIRDYIPAIRKVTAEDVRRVANAYLRPEQRTVGFLRPKAANAGDGRPAGTPAGGEEAK